MVNHPKINSNIELYRNDFIKVSKRLLRCLILSNNTYIKKEIHMKKSSFPQLLLFSSVVLLLFTGCSKESTQISTPTTTYPSISTNVYPSSTNTTQVVPDSYDALSSATPDVVSVKTPTPDGHEEEVAVVHFPDNVIFLDYIAYDMCAAWGILESFDYLTIQDNMPDYLRPYMLKESTNLSENVIYGDLTDINLFEPEVIFLNRYADAIFDELSASWPTLSYNIYYEESTYEKFKAMLHRNGSIFGLYDQNDEIYDFYDRRLAMIRQKAQGYTALTVMYTEDGMFVLSDDTYGSMLFHDVGMVNAAQGLFSSYQPITNEMILEINPDYLVVFDRNFQVSTEDLLNNRTLQQTSAWQNNQMIYLDSTAWYGYEFGTLGMDIALSNLESAFDIVLSHQLTNVLSIWWDDEEYHPTTPVYNLLDESTLYSLDAWVDTNDTEESLENSLDLEDDFTSPSDDVFVTEPEFDEFSNEDNTVIENETQEEVLEHTQEDVSFPEDSIVTEPMEDIFVEESFSPEQSATVEELEETILFLEERIAILEGQLQVLGIGIVS